MMMVDIDAMSTLDRDYNFSGKQEQSESRFHSAIFSPLHSMSKFSHPAMLESKHSPLDQKVSKAFDNEFGGNKLMITRHRGGGSSGGASVEGGVELKWGDPKGPSWSASASAGVHDNKGNHAKVEVRHSSDNQGGVNLTAGHDSNRASQGDISSNRK